jgi:chemotaxis protein histidine kinase CheA
MNMVNEIGGNVKLESEIGMGTTVSLTIPTSGNSKAAVL